MSESSAAPLHPNAMKVADPHAPVPTHLHHTTDAQCRSPHSLHQRASMLVRLSPQDFAQQADALATSRRTYRCPSLPPGLHKAFRTAYPPSATRSVRKSPARGSAPLRHLPQATACRTHTVRRPLHVKCKRCSLSPTCRVNLFQANHRQPGVAFTNEPHSSACTVSRVCSQRHIRYPAHVHPPPAEATPWLVKRRPLTRRL